jgi:hypothetical protein
VDDEKWTKPDEAKDLALADLAAFYDDAKEGIMIETPAVHLGTATVKMEEAQSPESMKFSIMARETVLLHEK